tara:strand:+ start:79 stop:1008 length:930 start_codon:yes stop_codon:yes gene_type:complete
MGTYKTDNSMHVFVGTADFDGGDALAAAENNQIVIVNADGSALATAGTDVIVKGTRVKVQMKDAAGNVRQSPVFAFDYANVKGLAFATRTEQTTTLDLCDDTPNTRYTMRINFKHNTELFSNQSDQYFFEYTTGDTVTAGEVMQKFVAKINAQESCKDKVSASYVATDGMTIVGQPQDWSLGLHAYTMVLFDVTIDGFASTATNVVTGAVHGSGAGEEVAELEWFGMGASGAPYRQGIPSNNHLISLNAVSTAEYDIAVIDTPLEDPKYAVAGAGAGRCQIVLAVAVGATGAELDEALGFTDDSLDIFS